MKNFFIKNKFNLISISLFLITLVVILLKISEVNYLLFHTMAEGFSIVISLMMFTIAVISKENSQDQYYNFLGYSYLFVGILDFLHTVSYSGMQIFTDKIFYANQLWICSRIIESCSLLIFALKFNDEKSDKKINFTVVFLVYLLISSFFVLTIFIWKIFPECYNPIEGQTNFKIFSELVIIGILISANIILFRRKKSINNRIYYYIAFSILLTTFSELSFTVYKSNYSIVNFYGHILKVISFFCIFKSIVETGIKRPMDTFYQKLQAKQEKLIELNSTKDKFFSIIGHDLKNPFGNIIVVSEMIMREAGNISVRNIQEYAKIINQSSTNAYKLLENLLYWSRMQTNRVEFNPDRIILKYDVNEVINLLMPQIFNKKIEIKNNISPDISLIADREMINLLFRNLISNAVKFTNTGGRVTIKAEYKDETKLRGEVSDNGIGMAQETIDKLFRIESNFTSKGTAKERGTGLGLIFCKEIVEKHSGIIWAESELGKGSKFIFEINRDNKL